jgi:hypothetical protein
VRDLLIRLQDALPTVEAWVANLHRIHASASVAPGAMGIARLAEYLPGSLLKRARAVVVDEVPFPPVVALGLPEFKDLADMQMAGITFGHMYFLNRQHVNDATHLHELVHVIQWSTLGTPAFLSTYAVGIVLHGYGGSPFEMAAFDMQGRFERGESVGDLAGFIAWHAEQVCSEAEEVFRSVGLTIGRRTSE